MAAVSEIKGVSEALAAKLAGLGIKNSDQLLEKANSPQERRDLAAKLGIDAKQVLEMANRADLIRIKGVAGAFSDMLENAGVDTVKELASRVPGNLQPKLVEINEKMKLSQRTPTVDMVADWVNQAKALPKILEY